MGWERGHGSLGAFLLLKMGSLKPQEVKKLVPVKMLFLSTCSGAGLMILPLAPVLTSPAFAPVSPAVALWTLRAFILSSLPGLLNLEKLLRQFLISKDTLSVRMLDDTQDPTPLLKEIRDDKTATIIIHANASMSRTILLKVGAGLGGR